MKCLFDSDFLYGFILPADVHHATCVSLFEVIEKKSIEKYVLSSVIQETATFLSYRIGQQASVQFLDTYWHLELTELELDKKVTRRAWELFKEQKSKRTSFIDCANLAVTELYNIDAIASFDTFYPESLRFGG